MQTILFMNEKTPFACTVTRLSDTLMKIEGITDLNLSGFHILNNNGNILGKYEDFTSLYERLPNGFILSNNGSELSKSDRELRVESLREQKIKEMEEEGEALLRQGYSVTLTDRSVEHFPLSANDELELVGTAARVAAGEENIPWHTSDESQPCRFFSNADAKIFTDAALLQKTWNITYLRDLSRYIRSLQTEEEIKTVVYGMDIPIVFQSEPLKAMLAANS